jgi:hypothetical protein
VPLGIVESGAEHDIRATIAIAGTNPMTLCS